VTAAPRALSKLRHQAHCTPRARAFTIGRFRSARAQLDERDAICPFGPCKPDEALRVRELEAQAQSKATVCNVAFALGGAAVLGGIALALTARSSSPRGPSALKFMPWAGPNSGGANVGGHW